MEGQILAGRYRLEQLAGEGGLALVYRGTDTSLDRPVAIKVLRPKFAQEVEALARFRSEARAAAKLNHPNIVQIFDTGTEGDMPFIIEEYLPEPNLKQIFEQYAPLPSHKVNEVISQCCRALSVAHKAGLVHRDVKPQNILFTNDGIAKLSDFGIAAAAGHDSLSGDGMVLGSAHYLSPEQAQGKPMGPQSDLYSLGCVMYEALTGHTPFTGETPAQIAAMHVEQRPLAVHLANPTVTPSEEFIVNKAMAKDPARRYQSAEEMLADLDKLAAGEDLDRTGVLRPTPEATMPMRAAALAPPGPVAPSHLPPPPRRVPQPARPEPVNGWAIFFGVLLALVILGVGAYLVKVAFYPGTQGKTVQVPSLEGQTEAEAKQQLEELGLKYTITYEENDAAPQGTVTRQTPAAGQMLDTGGKVQVVIARGKEIVEVVNVVGLSLEQADQRLANAGLTLGETTPKPSREPEGTVIGQSIRVGTRVEKGTALDLDLSSGPESAANNETAMGNTETGAELPGYPDVHVEQDMSYHSTEAGVVRWIVRVTPQGTAPTQKVDIWYTDQRGRVRAWSGTLEPGTVQEVKILGRGRTTVEVRRDDQVVFEDAFEATPPSAATP